LEYGTDPTTQVCGIKYEEPLEETECEVITFTLSGFTELGEIEVGVKSGPNSTVLTALGPTPIGDCDCSALPVELAELWIKDNILYWTSYSEIGFDYYSIEAFNNDSWVEMGIVYGGSLDYQYNLPATKKDRLYRLKMIDLNGSYEYSNIVVHKGTKNLVDSRMFNIFGKEIDVVYPMQVYIQDGRVKVNTTFEIR